MDNNTSPQNSTEPTLETQDNAAVIQLNMLWKMIRRYLMILGITLLIILFSGYAFFWRTPTNFPLGSTVTIHTGDSLQAITRTLVSQHVVRSANLFRTLVILFGGEKKIVAGDYVLKKTDNPGVLASRLIRGDFGVEPIKITIPEGFNSKEISDILAKNIQQFDTASFLRHTQGKEGYLFPNTYFFPPTVTSADIISRMQKEFAARIDDLQSDIKALGRSERDVVIMASILEGEAKTTKDRQIVAGILWARIDAGMPLQVDATFKYINGKTTAQLTTADLKIDSKYNTYRYAGLPPTPINNPGEDALYAALHPTKTSYVYFLTDKRGVMHYAETFEEHKKNKEKYLTP